MRDRRWSVWCIHTFYRPTCPDCQGAMAWQAVITGNVFLLTLPRLGRIVLIDSASVVCSVDGDRHYRVQDWVLHVR